MIPPLRTAAPIAASILLGAANVAAAQSLEVGAKSGLAHGSVPGGDFQWTRNSAANAIFLQLGFGDRFFVVPEAMLSRRIGTSTLPTSTLTLVADYVELPLMLQARSFSHYGIAPFVSLGPSVLLRVRCRLQFVGGGISTDDDCDDARYPTNAVDVAVNAGAGLAWHPGFLTLLVEGRFTAGLRENVMPTGVMTGRARGWSAMAGISVPLLRSREPPRPPRGMPIPIWQQGVENAPAPAAAVPRVHEPAEPGGMSLSERRISVDAEDVDVRDVLTGIAEAAGITVIISPVVSGRVTLTLRDVSVESALASVVSRAGLAMVRSMESGAWVIRVQPLPRGER